MATKRPSPNHEAIMNPPAITDSNNVATEAPLWERINVTQPFIGHVEPDENTKRELIAIVGLRDANVSMKRLKCVTDFGHKLGNQIMIVSR